MYARELEVLGPIKHALLQSQGKSIKAKDMNLEVQGTFYRPREIIHASDKMAQRIVVLRPVDILYSLVRKFKNIPQIVRGLEL